MASEVKRGDEIWAVFGLPLLRTRVFVLLHRFLYLLVNLNGAVAGVELQSGVVCDYKSCKKTSPSFFRVTVLITAP